MSRRNMMAQNACYSGLFGVLMQIFWGIAIGNTSMFSPIRFIVMFLVGAVIGSVCMFALLHMAVLNKRHQQRTVYMTVFIDVLLVMCLYAGFGLIYHEWCFNTAWIFILLFSVVFTGTLTYVWTKQLQSYQKKLESKQQRLH